MAVKWLEAPEAHDFDAAATYLSMLAETGTVTKTVDALRAAPMVMRAAKDILRAARLPLLETANPHVASDLAKVRAGTPLSPVLLVRGVLAADQRLEIADGYHRVCACYHTDENIDIPCLVVDR